MEDTGTEEFEPGSKMCADEFMVPFEFLSSFAALGDAGVERIRGESKGEVGGERKDFGGSFRFFSSLMTFRKLPRVGHSRHDSEQEGYPRFARTQLAFRPGVQLALASCI